MPVKRKQHKSLRKKLQKGGVGYFFIFGMVAFLIIMGLVVIGGVPIVSFPEDGQEVKLITPTPDPAHNSLQLRAVGFVTIAPTKPPTGYFCKSPTINSEPEILIGYTPAPGDSVSTTGQVKVWVEDEFFPLIAPNEQVNLSTGQIIKPGDRTAKAPDGLLWEPALYISPQTAESGGAPHFPDLIKGQFSNNPPATTQKGIKGADIDDIPDSAQKTASNPLGLPIGSYTAEYIWNVSSLGLSAGTYQAEFVIHDGDTDRGIGCVSIQIK